MPVKFNQYVSAVKGPFAAVVVNVFDAHSLASLDVKMVFRKIPGIVDDKLQYLPFVARGEKTLVGGNTGIVGQAEGQMPLKLLCQLVQFRLPARFMVQRGGDKFCSVRKRAQMIARPCARQTSMCSHDRPMACRFRSSAHCSGALYSGSRLTHRSI